MNINNSHSQAKEPICKTVKEAIVAVDGHNSEYVALFETMKQSDPLLVNIKHICFRCEYVLRQPNSSYDWWGDWVLFAAIPKIDEYDDQMRVSRWLGIYNKIQHTICTLWNSRWSMNFSSHRDYIESTLHRVPLSRCPKEILDWIVYEAYPISES
jgi:hypothetical protein